MTQGDFETFYPFQAGIGKNAPNNFESSYHNGYSAESSATGDPDDDSKDNQNNTDYEGEVEQVGGLQEDKKDCYKGLVKAKKEALKAQFGKGFFKTTDGHKKVCVNVPYTDWNPNINCKNVLGIKVCLGGFIGGTRNECNTIDYPEIAWIPGWRREWRRFKRGGGLEQLKQQCITGVVPPKSTNNIVSESLNISGKGNVPSGTTTKETNNNNSKINSYLVIGIIGIVLIFGGIYIFKTLKK